jgi:hypothetical protein
MNTRLEAPLPAQIGGPALRALAAVGVTRLDHISRFSERDLLALHGVGPKAVRILRSALEEAETKSE